MGAFSFNIVRSEAESIRMTGEAKKTDQDLSEGLDSNDNKASGAQIEAELGTSSNVSAKSEEDLDVQSSDLDGGSSSDNSNNLENSEQKQKPENNTR